MKIQVTAIARERAMRAGDPEVVELMGIATALLETLIEFGLDANPDLACIVTDQIIEEREMVHAVIGMAVACLTEQEREIRKGANR